jgi:hypothetical protein
VTRGAWRADGILARREHSPVLAIDGQASSTCPSVKGGLRSISRFRSKAMSDFDFWS